MLSVKPRGLRPPAGAIWVRVSAPFQGLIVNEMMGSEGILVLLVASKLSIWRLFSPREERMTKRLSGY